VTAVRTGWRCGFALAEVSASQTLNAQVNKVDRARNAEYVVSDVTSRQEQDDAQHAIRDVEQISGEDTERRQRAMPPIRRQRVAHDEDHVRPWTQHAERRDGEHD
jgi:ribosomal protein L20A (L18A)